MNIQSERGIRNRQIRSIQTEGHFGDIKENEDFRRFNYRSKDKAYKEFMLFAIGRNINKYHRFLSAKLKNSRENFWRKQLRKEANAKFQTRGFLRPKIDNIIENRSILDKSAKPKSLVLARILLFCAVRIKFTYFPTAPLFIQNRLISLYLYKHSYIIIFSKMQSSTFFLKN